MSRPIGSKTVYFSKVKEAREALKDKALDLFEQYQSLIRDAIAAQDFETASKGLQFLMEHMPKDDDGTTLLESSVDKPKVIENKGGPTIQIGFSLGGINTPKELPPSVIDITPAEIEEDHEL